MDQLQGHEDDVLSLTALTDGRLVSGSRDGTVRLWDQIRGPGSMNSEKLGILRKILLSIAERSRTVQPTSYCCSGVLRDIMTESGQ